MLVRRCLLRRTPAMTPARMRPSPSQPPSIFKGTKADLKKVTSGGLASFMNNFSDKLPVHKTRTLPPY